MLKELYRKGEMVYCMCDEYKPEFLEPVGKYVLWKLKTCWDDYNELYHAAAFFEKVNRDKTIQIDSHLMFKENEICGSVFILRGNLSEIEKRLQFNDEKSNLLLKYFHIVEKGRGYGKIWLNEVILPYYKSKSFTKIYLASSHPDSFRFYEKFGNAIGEYNSKSDNQLFVRMGKFFMLEL